MLALGFYYIHWHYSRGVRDLFNIVINFLWFFKEFFSIHLLLQTLFTPFQRLQETTHGFHPSEWIESKIVNALMRLTGAAARLFLIALGIAFMMLTVLVGAIMLIIWLAAPVVLAALVLMGLFFFIAG